jgi:hypothetical protein
VLRLQYSVVRQNSDRHSNQRVGRSARLRVCPYDTDFMLCLLRTLAVLFICVFRSRRDLLLENLALRQQLVVLKQGNSRPLVSTSNKLFWVILRRLWPEWRHALILVQPETVVRWHRARFKLYWTWLSRRRVRAGRKCVSKPGPTSPQSPNVRTGTNLPTWVIRVAFFLRPPDACSLTTRSKRSIVAALIASSCFFTPSSNCRWPCRSMAITSSGNEAFNRLPQILSEASQRTISASFTAS